MKFSKTQRFSAKAAVRIEAIALATFLAASTVPTPLYRIYQENFGFSPLTLTLIFGAYAFALLLSLLTLGALSDTIGRKPAILIGLSVNMIAMLGFAFADSTGTLIFARIVQGLATGVGMSALGAAILDCDKAKGSVINAVSPLVGMCAGAVVASLFVVFLPAPTQLIYFICFATMLFLVVSMLFTSETVTKLKLSAETFRPRVFVPEGARSIFVKISPANIAVWALGGFYLSLMPSVLRHVTGINSPVLGGVMVAAITLSGVAAVLIGVKRDPQKTLVTGTTSVVIGVGLTLAGIYLQNIVAISIGSLIGGFGFGSTFSASLRLIVPLAAAHERGGLLSSYYLESYLAFCVPTILIATQISRIGLINASYIYGGLIIFLAAVSLFALHLNSKVPKHPIPFVRGTGPFQQ